MESGHCRGALSLLISLLRGVIELNERFTARLWQRESGIFHSGNLSAKSFMLRACAASARLSQVYSEPTRSVQLSCLSLLHGRGELVRLAAIIDVCSMTSDAGQMAQRISSGMAHRTRLASKQLTWTT